MRWVISFLLATALSTSAWGRPPVHTPQPLAYWGTGGYFGGYSGMGVPPSIYTPVNVYVVPQWNTPYFHQPYYRPIRFDTWPR